MAQVGVGSRVHSLHRYWPFPGSDTEPNYARALWRCVHCRNCGPLTVIATGGNRLCLPYPRVWQTELTKLTSRHKDRS